MWIIDSLIIHYSSHPGVWAHPFTLEMLRVKECTPIPSFTVSTFGFAFESFKECGGVSQIKKKRERKKCLLLLVGDDVKSCMCCWK